MLRIRKTRWKIAYVVGAVALTFLSNSVVLPLVLPYPVDALVGSVLLFVVYIVGSRIFRGHGEPVEPPRVWWRMTSKPRAGIVIGSLLIASVANEIYLAITLPDLEVPIVVFNAIFDGTLAYLYFRSSVLLRRYPQKTVAEEERLPKWRPIKS